MESKVHFPLGGTAAIESEHCYPNLTRRDTSVTQTMAAMRYSRRGVLRSGAATMSATAIGLGFDLAFGSEQATSTQSEIETEIVDESVASLARRINAREISSYDVVSAFLTRISQVNLKLNAVVRLRAEQALEDAKACDQELANGQRRGALHGVPFTVKDSFDTAGVVSTAGTTGRANHIPERDASVVKRLRDAGGILLGKTNTPELTLSYQTANRVYGTTHNPYDVTRSPGGSSGGAAAILAASGSPFDVVSDSAGSARIPAHFCGVASLKPTAGRVPRTGHIIGYRGPLQALTQIGVMARYVADLRLLLPLIAGPDGVDPHIVPMPLDWPSLSLNTLRIAYFPSNGSSVPTRDTVSAISAAVAAVKPHVAFTKSAFPPLLLEGARLNGLLVSADGMDWAKRILAETGTDTSSLGNLRRQMPVNSTSQFVQLIERWDELKSRSLKLWRDFDAIICPVSAAPAHATGEVAPGLGSYVGAVNLLGLPTVVVRAGTSTDGLPIGIQVIAPSWREDIALAVAQLIETELGGWTPIENMA